VKDFRPISIVHNFAKILAKLLAIWLASILHDTSNQSVFIKDRFIQDNYILIQQNLTIYIGKNSHVCFSDLIFLMRSIQSLGLSSLKSCKGLDFGQIWKDLNQWSSLDFID
jgi:hypothetical protein